jgi:hypothetical protein
VGAAVLKKKWVSGPLCNFLSVRIAHRMIVRFLRDRVDDRRGFPPFRMNNNRTLCQISVLFGDGCSEIDLLSYFQKIMFSIGIVVALGLLIIFQMSPLNSKGIKPGFSEFYCFLLCGVLAEYADRTG